MVDPLVDRLDAVLVDLWVRNRLAEVADAVSVREADRPADWLANAVWAVDAVLVVELGVALLAVAV